MHSTNKAFERYFRIEIEDVRGIYRKTRADKEMTKDFGLKENYNHLKFIPKNGGGGGSRTLIKAMISNG